MKALIQQTKNVPENIPACDTLTTIELDGETIILIVDFGTAIAAWCVYGKMWVDGYTPELTIAAATGRTVPEGFDPDGADRLWFPILDTHGFAGVFMEELTFAHSVNDLLNNR